MKVIEEQKVAEDPPGRPDTQPEQDERGLRFEDPYWDDAFCAWWDPTLRTCC
jgi:hypothetical protein